jgi:hypothetical protein
MVMLQRKKRILRITWIAVNSTGEFSFSFFWVLFISLGITFLTSFFSLFFFVCYETATGGYGGKRLLEF